MRESEDRWERDAAGTRRQFLAAGAIAGGGLLLGACGSDENQSGDSSAGAASTLPWLTWADHYVPKQLQAVATETKVTAKPSLIGDNAPTLLKVKQTGNQFSLVSGDVLWLPKYHQEGLTELLDLDSISVSSELYSVARDSKLIRTSAGAYGFPFAWSTKPIFYNAKFVKTKPSSWQALLSPDLRKRIVLEGDSVGVLTIGGLATGAAEPFNMNKDEIAAAKEYLTQLKPNVLKFVSQANEVTRALANESAWVGIGNLGLDVQVKNSTGVEVTPVIPSEGTYGFADAEQVIKASQSIDAFERWVDRSYRAEWCAKNFLEHGRPVFNEAAYKLLVKQGHRERADRLFYNQPELAFEQTLLGPADNQQAYTDAYNELFGS